MSIDLRVSDPLPGHMIVMPGSRHSDFSNVHLIASEFGWNVTVAKGLDQAVEAHRSSETAGVLFHRDALGLRPWPEALHSLKAALPGAHLIPCCGFSERIDWSALSDAGAFHVLAFPLRDSEVRQSFGFLWQAAQRSTAVLA